jgi:hypothetical protein
MSEKERIELLHKKYLSLRENTPWEKRDGEECKAYHEWYDSAYVYFKSLEHLQNDSDFKIFVNAEKEGNCFVLEHIYDSICPSYKVVMQKIENAQKTDAFESIAKTPMVFISHSSKDIEFVEALVTLLESIGFNNKTLFCSSIPDYWIGLSKDIFTSLRQLFTEHELFVIFIQSPRYFESAVSLNEMGAAWVLQTDYCSILTRDMQKEKMNGVVDDHTIFLKVDAPQVEARMNELKNTLTNMFGLPAMSDTTWERKRNTFLKAVNAIDYPPVVETNVKGTNPVNEEYMKLQVEKLKREEMERKQAKIRGNIIPSKTRGNRILKIFNAGQTTARNVGVEWLNPDEEVLVQWEFGLIGEISPQNGRQYNIALCEGHTETMRLRYTWADDYSDNNVFEEDVQL